MIYVRWIVQFQSSAQLHIASALGGGLLIGSALGIIIPEGFHALPHHCEHDHDTVHRTKDSHDELHDEHGEGIPAGLPGLALVVGFLLMMLLENLQSGDSHFHVHEHDSASGSDGILLRGKSDGDDMEVSRGNNSKGSAYHSYDETLVYVSRESSTNLILFRQGLIPLELEVHVLLFFGPQEISQYNLFV